MTDITTTFLGGAWCGVLIRRRTGKPFGYTRRSSTFDAGSGQPTSMPYTPPEKTVSVQIIEESSDVRY